MKDYRSSDLDKKTFSATAGEEVASEIYDRDMAATLEQMNLWPRWEANEAMYWGDEGSSGVQMLRNVPTRIINLVGPRVRRTRRQLGATLFSPTPAVQALIGNREQTKADVLEAGLADIMLTTGVKASWRRAVQFAQLNGQAFLHPMVSEKRGLEHGMIHSRNMTISPSYGVGLLDLDMIGHTLWKARWFIKAQQDAGYYSDHFDVEDLVADIGGERHVGQSTTANPTTGDSSGGMNALESIRLKRLIVQLYVDGKVKRYVLTYAPDTQTLLRIAPYTHKRPDYSVLRLHDEHDNFWFGSSTAYELQGLQHLYTDVHNLLVYGSMVSALPPIFVSGGHLDESLADYGVAEIIEVDAEIKAQPMPIRFDGRAMPGIIMQLERVVDMVTGQSQNAAGVQLRGNATATESERLAAYQSVNDDDYADFGGESLEDYWSLVQQLCVAHAPIIEKHYGGAINPEFWDVYDLPVTWDAIGKADGQSPSARREKYAILLSMADKPDSDIYRPELESLVIDNLDLRVDKKRILGKRQKLIEQLQAQAGVGGGVPGADGGVVQQPGMGVGPGMA